MASVVDICNFALGHIGDRAMVTSIAPPDGSVQSRHCARLYPQARDELLAIGYGWSFATSRVACTLITDETDEKFSYAYAVPSAALRVLKVLDAVETPGANYAFRVFADDSGNRVLYTDVQDARVEIIRSISNTSKFTPLFVSALGLYLGSLLAGPIAKNVKLANELRSQALRMLNIAAGVDANSSGRPREVPDHQPLWVTDR